MDVLNRTKIIQSLQEIKELIGKKGEKCWDNGKRFKARLLWVLETIFEIFYTAALGIGTAVIIWCFYQELRDSVKKK